MSNKEREKQLREIKEDVINCKKCSLYKTRIYPVIGKGNHNAQVFFIGEAPGFNESKTGIPFCGLSGKVLDELFGSIKKEKNDVYITNILKDRPPNNRNPNPEEIKACVPYLKRQIEIINPKIICSLGNYATKYIFEYFGLKDKIEGISKLHGKVFETETKLKIIPLYHPAVAVYNANMKSILKKDFQVIEKILNQIHESK